MTVTNNNSRKESGGHKSVSGSRQPHLSLDHVGVEKIQNNKFADDFVMLSFHLSHRKSKKVFPMMNANGLFPFF